MGGFLLVESDGRRDFYRICLHLMQRISVLDLSVNQASVGHGRRQLLQFIENRCGFYFSIDLVVWGWPR